MQLITASSGSYPRLGKGSVGHNLRKAWHNYDNGKVSKEEIQALEDSLAQEIIAEQEGTGIDLITDGLVRWYCPISHIAGKMAGVQPGMLHHFLDTNFHVRKAKVFELPRWEKPLIMEEFLFARSAASKPVKAVLTGPATLLHYTQNETKFSLEQIEDSYVQALKKEIRLLANAGARFFQIDDPLLLEEHKRWSYYLDAYQEFKKAAEGVLLEVKAYGAASLPYLDNLVLLPADILGIDCVSDPQVLNRLGKESSYLSQKIFSLGTVDSRTKRIENPEVLARMLEPFCNSSAPTLFLEPSYGLEFTTRRYARAKLETLARTKILLEGSR